MKAPAPDFSYIYIAGIPSGPIKIGHAMCVKRRLKQLIAEHRREIVPLGDWPVGTRKAHSVERYIHWSLRDKLYRGEWFNVSLDEARAAVEHGVAMSDQINEWDLIPPVDVGNRVGKYGEHVMTKLVAGTNARIDAALKEGQFRADFIREAVEEKLSRKPSPPSSDR